MYLNDRTTASAWSLKQPITQSVPLHVSPFPNPPSLRTVSSTESIKQFHNVKTSSSYCLASGVISTA